MSAPRSFRRGRPRRVRSIATFSVLILASLMWISAAQAVHNNGMFELDGNTVHNSGTTPPYDWNSLFDASGNRIATPDPINGPLLADAFVSDSALPDQTYFTSNKDIEPIASGVQHWGCDPINNPLAKDNVLNAYAALVQVPANAPENGGDQVLYLASERASNNGTSFAGFWLLKDKNVGCSGSNNFSGHHTDGDLLIISDYTNGGGTQDVSVYKWVGDDATGKPVLDASFNGSICTSAPGNDNACAIANSSTITTPWSPTSHDSNTFVEAGIDLTTLLGADGGCFTNFLAETRSSNQLTATLKDFAGGQFSTCVPPTLDTTATPGGSVNPTGVASQHDLATISAVGGRPDPNGTISFFLCSPSQVTAGGCVSGGTQIGGAVAIDSGSATSTNASGSLTTAAGKYCWRAEYTPDADGSKFYVAGSHTNSDSECFFVQASPSVVTTPSETSGSVGDVLNDSATLSDGSNFDGKGTITFNLYGPNDPACDGTPAYSETVPADHNGSDYSTSNSSVAANEAGTWNWTADFSGDTNNNPASSGCGEESVVIHGAAIHIAKAADAAEVMVGEDVGFTMTVWNSGDGDAHGVTLSDKLPANAGLDWQVAGQGAGWAGSCSISQGTLSCGPVTVPAGTTQAASAFTVHVTSTTSAATGGDCPGSGAVDNTGTVATTNDGSDESSASTCVQALVDLSVTKSGSPATQDLGAGNITWTMVVTNNGPDADTNVVVSDPMPAGNTFVSAATTKGTCTGGAVLNCTIGPMAAGESVTITLVTTPSAAGTQTNTVHVAGDRPETNTDNNTATATVEITAPFVPPPVFCVAVSKVTPKQLFVGRKTTLTIHLTKHGQAVKGVHVRIKGAKINLKTKASNSKGIVKQTLKMKKAGILVFTPIASKACNTKRIGVTNVFTPPVTG